MNKTRNINNAYRNITRLIWECADSWQYDDSNQTDLPIAVTDLVHEQQDYSLPSDAQRVHKIEVMNDNGDYQLLKQKDLHDITQSTTEYLETPGMPLYYDIFGSTIMFYPKPTSAAGGVTLASGMKVYFDRDVSAFTTGSGTREPGFANPFHRLLSISASLDFEKDAGQRNMLLARRAEMEEGLRRFYSKRNIQGKTAIKPYTQKRWKQYL